MILNLAALKRIKPTGSVDEWESGADGTHESPAQMHQRINDAIYKALDDNVQMSISEIVKATGASQGGTWGIIDRLKKSGKVTMIKRKVKGAQRPVQYYSRVA